MGRKDGGKQREQRNEEKVRRKNKGGGAKWEGEVMKCAETREGESQDIPEPAAGWTGEFLPNA